MEVYNIRLRCDALAEIKAFVAQLDRALASGAKGRKFESCRARQSQCGTINIMVAIAQLVEPWIVIPVVAGSNPVIHPIFKKTDTLLSVGFFIYVHFISYAIFDLIL